MAIPITIITGFLGSGKTTLILNLLPQLPKEYKLALLKNEFGDVNVDSELAKSSAISGVEELTNGCICCNLVGQLGDALKKLREDIKPDRIVIETSGSALPTTLVLEVNSLIRETGFYSLDGVINVIDVINWTGYEDTSYTTKAQARYTDLIILNKWELASEREYDTCLDHLGALEGVETPTARSDHGKVPRELIFGVDRSLAQDLESNGHAEDHEHHHHHHDHSHNHSSEVEVLSCTLEARNPSTSVDTDALLKFLRIAEKDEIYRIKAKVWTNKSIASSDGTTPAEETSSPSLYLLNWAFCRWTFTRASSGNETSQQALRMTVMTARSVSTKWKKRLESGEYLKLQDGSAGSLSITRIDT